MKLALRLVLVAAFLLAQTAGIAHQAWHDAGAKAGHSDAPKKNQLCDFHTALGNVLGAVANTAVAPDVAIEVSTQFAATDSRAAHFSLLASRSRGPPALL